jgi:hypothetical protein
VGAYHSHWDNPQGEDNEAFSLGLEEDIWNAKTLCFGWGLCIHHYLLTPSMAIKAYDPYLGDTCYFDVFSWSWRRVGS